MAHAYVEILGNLTAALKGLTLYPAGHPGIAGPVGRFLDLMRPLLLEKREVPLAIVDEVLTLAGQPFYQPTPAAEELEVRMLAHGVEQVVFRFGLTPREVVALLELLRAEPESLREEGGLSGALRRKQVRNIELRNVPEGDEEVRERARVVYAEARGLVVNMMSELRSGRIPKVERAVQLLHTMNEILLKEPNALLCLTMLQDYDEYTFAHSVNVGILSLALGHAIGIAGGSLIEVGMAGVLHDVGKTKVAKEILNKVGRLTDSEWDEMKRHPEYGADMVRKMAGLTPFTAEAVLYHHAKYNLTGYPPFQGTGDLNLGSRVVAIADAYDSMTTLRPYQRRHDPRDALEIMGRLAGRDLDPDYFRTFVGLLGIYPVGTLVRLDTGELALVSRINPKDPARPWVRVLQGADGRRLDRPEERSTEETDPAGVHLRSIVETVDPMSQDPELYRVLTS